MTEPTERPEAHGAEQTEAFVAEPAIDETSLSEDFKNTVNILQDVGLTEPTATKGSEDIKKLDGQQQDGQTVSAHTANSSGTGAKWVVGAQCQAVWSGDGLVYPATVVSVDRDRCRVRFNGYGNEEDMELTSLKSLSTSLQPHEHYQDWKAGSRCRAVFSADGLVYPAVVLWVEGQRCRIRFDTYNNEEDQDVSNLLNPDEVHGPSRISTKHSSWKPSSASTNRKWRRRREEGQVERGGGGEHHQNPSWVSTQFSGERSSDLSKVEKEAEEKNRGSHLRDEAEKSSNHSFCLLPPYPPPQSAIGDALSFIPPPPISMFGGKESSGPGSLDTTSNMLMLWYLCGFHTGTYMAQQLFKSTSKD